MSHLDSDKHDQNTQDKQLHKTQDTTQTDTRDNK